MKEKFYPSKKIGFKLLSILLLCSLSILGQGFLFQPAQAKGNLTNDARPVAVTISGNTTPAIVSWGANRLDAFIVGSDNAIWHKYWDNGWGPANGWEYLGKPAGVSFISVTAVSWGLGRLDIFAVASGSPLHAVWHKFWENGWGPTSGWENIGSQNSLYLKPISWGVNRLDIFSTSVLNANPFQSKWWGINGGWGPSSTGWESQGTYSGTSVSSLDAVSWGSGRLDVFRDSGDSGTIYHKYYEGGWGPASGWENLGVVGKWPAVSSRSSNILDVFVRGVNPGQTTTVFHRAWVGNGWIPAGGWESLGGNSGGGITTISWDPFRIDLFEARTDGIYHKYSASSVWQPSVTGWTKLPAISDATLPVAVSWGPSRLDIFTTRFGVLWHSYSDDGVTFGVWESLGP